MITTIEQAKALLVGVANKLSANDEQSDIAADLAEIVDRLKTIQDRILKEYD